MAADLLQNVAVLFSLCFFHGLLMRRLKKGSANRRAVVAGLLFGVTAAAGMLLPFHYRPGVIYDGRSIVLALAGLFEGPLAAAIAALIAAGMRVWLGGVGVLAGVASIGGAAAAGLLWRQARRKTPGEVTVGDLLGVGLLAHVGVVLSQLLLPWLQAAGVLREVAPGLLTIFPLGTVAIGWLLADQARYVTMSEAMAAAQRRTELLFRHAPAGFVILDRDGRVEAANRRAAELLGAGDPLEGRRFSEVAGAFLDGDGKPLPHELDPVRRALERGESVAEIVVGTRKGEAARWLLLSAVPEKIPRGGGGGAMVTIADVTHLRETEQRLRWSESRYRLLAEATFDGVVISEDGIVVDANREAAAMVGCEVSETVGRDVLAWVAPEYRDMVVERIRSGTEEPSEVELVRRDGRRVPVEVRARVVFVDGRRLRLTVVRDLSERRQLEAQVRQAQKMEAIGRFAGGIAHDFNNMLMVILGYADLALRGTPPDSPYRKPLEEIRAAAKRSADLTRQILAFTRSQPTNPQVLDLAAEVGRQVAMLRRMVGDDIELEYEAAPDLWRVRMDPVHVGQILANLATNARDAIRGAGTIRVELANVPAGSAPVGVTGDTLKVDGVVLRFSDTGCGMDAATAERIFEPFFTTKEEGKGTGLGLSTVFGIVQQAGGLIRVDSEPGKRTTFEIYLPRAEAREDQVRSDVA